MSNRPYTVEVEKEACGHCGVGRMWTVVGPDGIALGQSWGEEEGAEELADAMNCAYAAGQSASARVGPWQTIVRNYVAAYDAHAAAGDRYLESGAAEDDRGFGESIDRQHEAHDALLAAGRAVGTPSEVPMQRGPMHSFCGDPECVICGGYSPVHDTDSPVSRQEPTT